MKKYLPVIFGILLLTQVSAQEKKTNYYLLPQLGLLNGDDFASGQVMVSGGIENKNISFGIGVAMEYYKIRTVPVFAEIRAGIGKSKRTFAYINAGPNFMWPLASQYVSHWIYNGAFSRDHFSTGFYGDAGLGYIFRLAKKNDMLVSLGYSVKTVHQSYAESLYSQSPPYTPETFDRKLDYTLNRLALRVGIKL
jgi:hypothetical protein